LLNVKSIDLLSKQALSPLSNGGTHLNSLNYSGQGLSQNKAPDNYALVFSISPHVVVRVVADSEDMRRQFADLFVLVLLDVLGRVDRQDLIGVDSDQYRPRVRLHIKIKN